MQPVWGSVITVLLILCHANCRSPRAKAMLGNTCYPYTFFDKELPGLFLNIYTVIKESATTEDDWTKRETLMDFFSN